MNKQKKQILTSYKALLEPVSNMQTMGDKSGINLQVQDSIKQAKKIKKIREIAANDASVNNSPEKDNNAENNNENNAQKPAFKRLLRGANSIVRLENPPLINPETFTKNIEDFDDPEDENWEIESNISLNFKPKKINTRTRTSTQMQHPPRENFRPSENGHGRQTRALRKKVVFNDDDSEFKDESENQEILNSEDEEYRNSESQGSEREEKKGIRNSLRRKNEKKHYVGFESVSEESDFRDDSEESFQFKKRKIALNNHQINK